MNEEDREVRPIQRRNLVFRESMNHFQLHFVGHRLGTFFHDIEVDTSLEAIKKRKIDELLRDDLGHVSKKRKLE